MSFKVPIRHPNAEKRERGCRNALKESPLRAYPGEDTNAHQHTEKICAKVPAGSVREIVPWLAGSERV